MPTAMELESQRENASTKKRRLAEVGISEGDGSAPAKRRREGSVGDGDSEDESGVERSGGVKGADSKGHTQEKEKKKRRKKKKKVSVVQQPHQQNSESSPAKSKLSSSSRTTAPSATLEPNGKQKDKKQREKEKQKEPTPGPSRLARSGSRSSTPGRDDNENIGEDGGGVGQENGSLPLDSTAPSLKGKERASSHSPHSHSPSSSNSQATEVAALTKKLDTITQTIFPSLICNICLYLMHRPFLLSPCGHVACLDCLVSWFSSEVPGQGQLMPQLDQLPQQEPNQDEQQNQPEQNQQEHNQPEVQPGPIYDAAGEIVGMVIPPPPNIPPLPPAPQLPPLPAPQYPLPPAPAPPLAPQLPLAPLPPAPAPRPLAKRKKTCPQCRARITTRPVEVWFAKDMVANIVRAGLADLDAVPPSLRPGAPPLNINGEPEADPWKDIFPNKKDRDGRRTRERELLREMREREWMGDRDDADGGVYRCVDCMTEIWEGVCAECGRIYGGHLPGARMSEFSFSDDDGSDGEGSEGSMEGEGDTDDDLGFMLGLHPNLRYLSESGSERDGEGGEGEGGFWGYGGPVQVTWTDDEMEPSDASGSSEGRSESEGYESSFIDDDGEGERQGREVVGLVGSSDDEGEGEGEEDAPRRRTGRIGRRSNPYVISSGEEDESGGGSPPVRRLGRRDGGVVEVASDEDEDEGSDDGGGGLAAEVAERERELYGDDGSVPSRRLRSRRETDGGEDGWDSELSDETTSVVEDGGVDYMDDDEDEL